ncbi:glycoside hydrolase [Paenibacillus antri]|uniref:Glycoside hydrolase n=1 Tax=Paenibacillus antri TaxID=2582848 RepID=A0A5R9G9N0_9BACL|nr:glycoside hydrolase 43 family protein [Paenibacillus antri]TLS51799.1 glycoside hydrolase [Paenibacillus antri]
MTYLSKTRVSDQGDGTFANPILHADYSDPDAIRVGEDFYMTASSFGHIPGLPILHSKDLINWRLIHHAIPHMPLPGYDKPQHGNGVWAPSIRFHDGMFWIFYGDPDVGIFMTKASEPAGEWSEIHLVHEGKGLIDACPFWDDDGQAYLVHAYAHSRSGIKHRLRVRRMSPDGRRLLDEGVVVIDDPERHPTIEGPKMYKRGDYYYIFAPAGGVEEGWQTVLRARHPFGPYEDRIVLKQGNSPVNGPHQGAWIELASGESWFMHFQHKDAYGRIVHLQPMTWMDDDWPSMGEDADGDGIGEPVLRAPKPNVGNRYPIETPATDDGFDQERLGLQWQWQANPESGWYSLAERSGWLRLYSRRSPESASSLYQAPYLLLQKFPALSFQAGVRLDGTGLREGDSAGLIVFGYSYAALILAFNENGNAELRLLEGDTEKQAIAWKLETSAPELSLRVLVEPGAMCTFQYSFDGMHYESVARPPFQATVSKWVGAKVGLFAQADREVGGYADFDDFTVTDVPR